jgi:hypothetical protein
MPSRALTLAALFDATELGAIPRDADARIVAVFGGLGEPFKSFFQMCLEARKFT